MPAAMDTEGGISVATIVTDTDAEDDTVVVHSLSFAYPGCAPVISDFSLTLPPGSRCLLLGANGAGKSTLLQILAGQHMHGRDVVRVLGRPAFHDIELVASGDVSYLGHQWRKDVSCAGYDIALQGDLEAGKMIHGVEGVDPSRRDQLINLLDIDLDWRMNKVSDGQRRRVQICLGLLKPYKVLLLDEVTVDMDVVGRLDLLDFFRQECEERQCSIIYCTHITDGLAGWLTHLAYVERGHLAKGGPVSEIAEFQEDKKLLHVVERWLRAERDTRPIEDPAATTAVRTAPSFASRHMAFYR